MEVHSKKFAKPCITSRILDRSIPLLPKSNGPASLFFLVFVVGSITTHGKVAWRLKSGAELAVAVGVTREEQRAMLEYVNEMESLSDPRRVSRAAEIIGESVPH